MTDPVPCITVAELRAQVRDLASENTFPTAVLEDLVVAFENRVEEYRGFCPSTRTATQTEDGQRRPIEAVLLDRPLVQAVTAITLDGSTYTGERVVNLSAGIVYLPGCPMGEVAVTYTYGDVETRPEIRRAARLFVWREALSDANPSTGNTYLTRNVELGTVEYQSTANMSAGRPTRWPDVNEILNALPDLRTGMA